MRQREGEWAGVNHVKERTRDREQREWRWDHVQPRPPDRQVVIYCPPADSHVVVSVPNWLSIISRWQPHPMASQSAWRLCRHPQGTAELTRLVSGDKSILLHSSFPLRDQDKKKRPIVDACEWRQGQGKKGAFKCVQEADYRVGGLCLIVLFYNNG